jgi:hypothetical protein
MIQWYNKQGKIKVNNTGIKMTRNNRHLLPFFQTIGIFWGIPLLFFLLLHFKGCKNFKD